MEYIKMCNVCKKVWCYNDEDLSRNRSNAALGVMASIGSAYSAFDDDPSNYDMYEMNKIANNARNRIVDYNKCPYCNSRDIKNITKEEYEKYLKEVSDRQIPINSNASVESLIKRVEIFIEDNEWDNARKYCNQILDIEPENPYAWLLKLQIENKWKIINNKIDLNKNYINLEENTIMNKLIRYSKNNVQIQKVIYNIKEEYYKEAINLFENIHDIYDNQKAIKMFSYIPKYKNSEYYIKTCELNNEKILKIQEKEKNKEKYKNILSIYYICILFFFFMFIAIVIKLENYFFIKAIIFIVLVLFIVYLKIKILEIKNK